MAQVVDISGQQFGRLSVLEYAGTGGTRKAMWRCRCDCGNTVTVRGESLRSGNTQSCGCYRKDLGRARRQPVVNYFGAHARVWRERGAATGHLCVDCANPACNWSYDGKDPDALHEARINCLYSLAVAHYEPRCLVCHRLYDHALRAQSAS